MQYKSRITFMYLFFGPQLLLFVNSKQSRRPRLLRYAQSVSQIVKENRH